LLGDKLECLQESDEFGSGRGIGQLLDLDQRVASQ